MKVEMFDYSGSGFETEFKIVKKNKSYFVINQSGGIVNDIHWAQVYRIVDATDNEIEALQKIGWLELDEEDAEDKYVAVD